MGDYEVKNGDTVQLPFIHKISTNVYEVISVEEGERAYSLRFMGRHAKQFAEEERDKILKDKEKDNG